MASNTTNTTTKKPSFAKVAATSYVPVKQRNDPTNQSKSQDTMSGSQDPSASSTELRVSSATENGTAQIGVVNQHLGGQEMRNGSDRQQELVSEELSPGKTGEPQKEDIQTAHEGSSKAAADDGSTQVSSSDGSLKQPGFDSKSFTSVTTFAMDEKDSVRPDDSASLRAVEEEDASSAPGTGPGGSRVGSDTGARAFRDQLHQISVMGAMATRPGPSERYQPQTILKPGLPFEVVALSPHALVPQAMSISPLPIAVPAGAEKTIPDEKLLEALASHRDRLFVLKLEQDLIDFIQNSKEVQLDLPQTHSFYRMLAHKLADYFMLDHAAKQHDTGTSIIIRKTQVCRLPPPLSTFSVPSTSASTPPPTAPTRKIMRRGGDPNSGTSTSVNSEGPSKATSEVGDGYDDRATPGGSQNKANLTREEREAKYKEVRERIFGNADEADGKEGEINPEDADISRSSSAAGKKKQRKKTPVSDDDFQPRSQFTGPQALAQSQFAPNGYGTPGMFYPAYQQPLSAQRYHGFVQNGGQLPYGSTFVPIQAQEQVPYSFQVQQTMNGMPYPGANNVNFDLSAQFQRGMQAFQNSSPSQGHGQLPTSQVGHPAQFSPQFPMQQQMPQQQSFNPAWQSPLGYNHTFPYGQQGYMQPQYPEQAISSPRQQPGPAYSFASPPSVGFSAPQNVYERAAFNPQTTSFLPNSTLRSGGMVPQQMPPFSPNILPAPTQNIARNVSTSPYAGSFNSSRSSSNRVNGTGNPHTQSPPTASAPLTTSTMTLQPSEPSQTTHGPQHSLPERPSADSSIAKWGTPSHLPAKPPPPASMEPLKYNELHKGVQGLPGLPKYTGNGMFEAPATSANSGLPSTTSVAVISPGGSN